MSRRPEDFPEGVSDAELGRRWGVSRQAVRQSRLLLGLPASNCRRGPKPQSRLQWHKLDGLWGVLKAKDLAAIMKCHVSTVYRKQKELGYKTWRQK